MRDVGETGVATMKNVKWDSIDMSILKRWAGLLGIDREFEINVRHEIDKYSEPELYAQGIIYHLFHSTRARQNLDPDLAEFWKLAEIYWKNRLHYEDRKDPLTQSAYEKSVDALNRLIQSKYDLPTLSPKA